MNPVHTTSVLTIMLVSLRVLPSSLLVGKYVMQRGNRRRKTKGEETCRQYSWLASSLDHPVLSNCGKGMGERLARKMWRNRGMQKWKAKIKGNSRKNNMNFYHAGLKREDIRAQKYRDKNIRLS